MEFLEVVLFGEILLSSLAGIGIIYAALRAAYLFAKGVIYNNVDANTIRLELGNGIILGLEFMIGADIIKSMAKPNYYDLGMLGLLVVIRTFLSYFLGKELEALKNNHKH